MHDKLRQGATMLLAYLCVQYTVLYHIFLKNAI